MVQRRSLTAVTLAALLLVSLTGVGAATTGPNMGQAGFETTEAGDTELPQTNQSNSVIDLSSAEIDEIISWVFSNLSFDWTSTPADGDGESDAAEEPDREPTESDSEPSDATEDSSEAGTDGDDSPTESDSTDGGEDSVEETDQRVDDDSAEDTDSTERNDTTDDTTGDNSADNSETPDETDNTNNTDSTDESDNTDEAALDVELVERYIHEAVNEERTKRGLAALSWNADLSTIAASHSQDMAERDYFSHTSPEGETFSARYEDYGYECRAPTGDGTYYTGGENIAYTYYGTNVRTDSGALTTYDTERELADGIVTQWMNSADHRENILQQHWNTEGIGVAMTEENRVYATQNFC